MSTFLKDARDILNEYKKSDSVLDIGNLYFAATQFEGAYEALAVENEQLKETISGKTFDDENVKLRAELELSKLTVQAVSKNSLAISAENERLKNNEAIETQDAIEGVNNKLFSEIAELRAELKERKEYIRDFEHECETINEMRTENKTLKQSVNNLMSTLFDKSTANAALVEALDNLVVQVNHGDGYFALHKAIIQREGHIGHSGPIVHIGEPIEALAKHGGGK